MESITDSGVELNRPHQNARSATGHLDVREQLVPGQVAVRTGSADADTLALLGRTEDLDVSPDGRRMVLAGYNVDGLAILEFEVDISDGVSVVDVSSVAVRRSAALRRPHGLTHLDDDSLIVANREAELLLVDLRPVGMSADLRTRVLVDHTNRVPVATPGSVHVHPVTDDVFEVLVCNNFAHTVNRYLLDRSADWQVIDEEFLLERELEVPDGVALSASGDWIAISNHVRHSVAMYRADAHLGPDTLPVGVLEGVNYPHGLTFAADDRCLIVADAGLPFIYCFESADADWSGRRNAARTTRVMTDEAFNLGRSNPQEGGPKGLALVNESMIAITCEEQPLAFFHLDTLMSAAAVERGAAGVVRLEARDRTAARVITRLADRLGGSIEGLAADARRTDEAVSVETRQREHVEELLTRIDQLVDEREQLTSSRSWRALAPLRSVADLFKRILRFGRR